MQGDLRTRVGVPSVGETTPVNASRPTRTAVRLSATGQDEFVREKKAPPPDDPSTDEVTLSKPQKHSKGFSVMSAVKHFAQGIISPVVNILKNPMGVLPILAIGGLGILAFGSAAGVIMGTLGLAFGAYQGVQFLQKLAEAENGEQSAEAFHHLGEAVSSVGLTGALGKYDLKGVGVKDVDKLGFFGTLKATVQNTPAAFKRCGQMIEKGEVWATLRNLTGASKTTATASRSPIESTPSAVGPTASPKPAASGSAAVHDTPPAAAPATAETPPAPAVAEAVAESPKPTLEQAVADIRKQLKDDDRLIRRMQNDPGYFNSLSSEAEKIAYLQEAMETYGITHTQLENMIRNFHTQAAKGSQPKPWYRRTTTWDKKVEAVAELAAKRELELLNHVSNKTIHSVDLEAHLQNIPSEFFKEYAFLSKAQRKEAFSKMTAAERRLALRIEDIIANYQFKCMEAHDRMLGFYSYYAPNEARVTSMLKADLDNIPMLAKAEDFVAKTPSNLKLHKKLQAMTPEQRNQFIFDIYYNPSRRNEANEVAMWLEVSSPDTKKVRTWSEIIGS